MQRRPSGIPDAIQPATSLPTEQHGDLHERLRNHDTSPPPRLFGRDTNGLSRRPRKVPIQAHLNLHGARKASSKHSNSRNSNPIVKHSIEEMALHTRARMAASQELAVDRIRRLAKRSRESSIRARNAPHDDY